MKVHSIQIEQMRSDTRKAFYDRLSSDVTAFMADADPATSTEVVRERLNAAYATAELDGVRTEREITRYAHILAAFPAGYRESPDTLWLVKMLQSMDDAEVKLDRISAVLSRNSSR